ncbi:reverse transcriptase domain-containing protein [Tanacetum coccineum]
MELHDVSYGIEYVARPLLLFFSSENRLLWFWYREYDLAHLKLIFEFSIYNVWKSVQYGVSNGLDTVYWGFLGVGTTFDIFQNIILIPYLEYDVLSHLDTTYCSLIFYGIWLEPDSPKMLFGFGVHPVTLDPTLLKINYPYYGQGPWLLNTNFPQTYLTPITTSEGVWCFSFGSHVGAILWNPSIRKFSGIEVPYMANRPSIEKIVWGFGVRPDTLDPTILNISMPFYEDGPWHVLMYTLNSDTWTVLGNYRLPRIGIRIKRSWGVAVLEVEADVVTSWRVLFVIPSQNIAKLVRFTMDDDPIVEVDSGQEIVHTLQVNDRPSQQFHNVGIEAFACRCGAEDVVLRESYQPKTRGKLYYACPKSKPRQNYYGCKFFLWKEERVGLLISSPGTSSTLISSPTPSTPPIHYGGSPSNTECSNCKHLLGRIKVLQATLEMHMHPEQHTLNSASLLHDLNNDMEKLGLE